MTVRVVNIVCYGIQVWHVCFPAGLPFSLLPWKWVCLCMPGSEYSQAGIWPVLALRGRGWRPVLPGRQLGGSCIGPCFPAFLCLCFCLCLSMTGEYRPVFAGYLSSQAKIRQLLRGLGVLRAPRLAVGVQFSLLPAVPNLQRRHL